MPIDDPFELIRDQVARAHLSDAELDAAITHTLEDIQSIWEISSGEFFYIALDEANVASQKHIDSFEDEHGRYPILKEIIRTLQRRMGHLPIKFVVAGTVIPPEHFQSKIREWDSFRWCSDTGSFDNPDVQRQYISQFLPPDLKNSDKGLILLDRMWRWLRGRHRYTASYLTVLLNNNYESPHTLLGD
ncbi:hypothetical protein BDP27DRAFT_1212899 [Rhodocollybia butyracea]|uniref:Uncharacterized protein n=1 Tax=Rhodocollybia butyracea TaxID=206335 RepID=A0A9P5Q4L4_9AGAR|nr:hypothetical protein BDP27DRAFT_1212899 [Rhodocollybia butyracea]